MNQVKMSQQLFLQKNIYDDKTKQIIEYWMRLLGLLEDNQQQRRNIRSKEVSCKFKFPSKWTKWPVFVCNLISTVKLMLVILTMSQPKFYLYLGDPFHYLEGVEELSVMAAVLYLCNYHIIILFIHYSSEHKLSWVKVLNVLRSKISPYQCGFRDEQVFRNFYLAAKIIIRSSIYMTGCVVTGIVLFYLIANYIFEDLIDFIIFVPIWGLSIGFTAYFAISLNSAILIFQFLIAYYLKARLTTLSKQLSGYLKVRIGSNFDIKFLSRLDSIYIEANHFNSFWMFYVVSIYASLIPAFLFIFNQIINGSEMFDKIYHIFLIMPSLMVVIILTISTAIVSTEPKRLYLTLNSIVCRKKGLSYRSKYKVNVILTLFINELENNI